MPRQYQFSLRFVLLQLTWLALALGAFRLLPMLPPRGTYLLDLEGILVLRCTIMSCIGFFAGSMIGGFTERMIVGGIVGAAFTAVVAGAYSLYLWAAVIANC